MTILIVVAVLAVVAGIRLRFWIKQGAKLQVNGYLPPAPSRTAGFFYRTVCRLFTFMFVGPIKVIGKTKPRPRGRLLIAPNHQYQFDFAVVTHALPYHMRYMAKTTELRGARGVVGAWTGAFGVDATGPGGGEAVVQASVKVLASEPDSALLIFPQGKLVQDNVLRQDEFKTGAARMLHQTAAVIDGQPLSILPVAVYYKRDAKDATFLHKLLMRCGFKNFRCAFQKRNFGANVAVGEPIAVESLPADAHEATEVVRARIQELLDKAMKA